MNIPWIRKEKKLKALNLVFLLLGYSYTYSQYQTDLFIDKNKYFRNPIFSGDYPDPSILIDGDNYYMVHSSFEYYPGLTIWHSRDMINWQPVANALTRYVGSVWAPDLVKYENKYYIYFPANNTNYVVTADSINGKWSDPVDLKIGNIDPCHFIDEQGNRYLYFSNGGYVPLSKDGLNVIGPFQHCYNGWSIPQDWTIECFCLEGPKLTKRGDYYYLTVAEGGTAGPATGHMVISARSKTPFGPWENSPYNPIIRAKSPNDKWWSIGHATIFETSKDNWWMVFHGYEKEYLFMGRQTLLVPIQWTYDDWFKLADDLELDRLFPKPILPNYLSKFTLTDSFNTNHLNYQWKFYREYDTNRFCFKNHWLEIKGKGNSIAESSPLLCIPAHHSYQAQVEIEIVGSAIGGLILFYSTKAYSGILADQQNILANLRGWQFITERNAINRHVFLKLINVNRTVDMYYSIDGNIWQ